MRDRTKRALRFAVGCIKVGVLAQGGGWWLVVALVLAPGLFVDWLVLVQGEQPR